MAWLRSLPDSSLIRMASAAAQRALDTSWFKQSELCIKWRFTVKEARGTRRGGGLGPLTLCLQLLM